MTKYTISEGWKEFSPKPEERELDYIEKVFGREETELEKIHRINEEIVSKVAKEMAKQIDEDILNEVFSEAKYSTTKPVVNTNLIINYTES